MAWLVEIALSNAVVAFGLAGMVWIISRCFRRPALTHSLWVLVLIKLITPSPAMISLPVVLHAEPAGNLAEQSLFVGNVATAAFRDRAASPLRLVTDGPTVSPAAMETGAGDWISGPWHWRLPVLHVPSAVTLSSPFKWMHWFWPVLGAIWLMGMCWRILEDLNRLSAFWVLVADLRGTASADGLVQLTADQLGLRTRPPFVFFDGICTPCLWGLGPCLRIIFPRELWERLSSDERSTLVAHELAHYARGDHYVRLLELIARTVFWWHPVVRWALHEIHSAEEECCDSWVVQKLRNPPRTYAEAMLSTLDFVADGSRTLIPGATSLSEVQFLEYRIIGIMRRSGRRTHSLPGLIVALGLACIVIPWGAVIRVEPAVTHAGPLSGSTANAESLVNTVLETHAGRDIMSAPQPADAQQVRSISRTAKNAVVIAPAPSVRRLGRRETISVASGRYRLHIEAGGHVLLENSRHGVQHDLSDAHITSAAFFSSGDRLITGSAEGLVQVWNCATGEPIQCLGLMDGNASSVAVESQEEIAVSTDSTGGIRTWSLRSGQNLQAAYLGEPIQVARFSQSGRRIALTTGDATPLTSPQLLLLDTESLEIIVSIPLRHSAATIDVVGESEVLVADWDGFVLVCDMLSGECRSRGMVSRQLLSPAAFSQNFRFSSRLFPYSEQAATERTGEAVPSPAGEAL